MFLNHGMFLTKEEIEFEVAKKEIYDKLLCNKENFVTDLHAIDVALQLVKDGTDIELVSAAISDAIYYLRTVDNYIDWIEDIKYMEEQKNLSQ